MQWIVVLHPEFDKWLQELEIDEQKAVATAAKVLQAFGPTLGRPWVDHVKDSNLSNLKELRVRSTGEPIRVLFAFDPWTKGVLLVGGNKAGDSKWYKKNIPIAEQRFLEHVERHKKELKENENEGKKP